MLGFGHLVESVQQDEPAILQQALAQVGEKRIRGGFAEARGDIVAHRVPQHFGVALGGAGRDVPRRHFAQNQAHHDARAQRPRRPTRAAPRAARSGS